MGLFSKKEKKEETSPLVVTKSVGTENPKLALEDAIYSLIKEQPFYAELITRCKISMGSDIPTAGVRIMPTGALEMYINPEFFLALTQFERCGLAMHEMLHLMNDHISRGAGLNHQISNVAMDNAINQMIPKRFLPGCAILPEGLAKDLNIDVKHNLNFEEYYYLLKSKQNKLEQYNNCPVHGQNGQQGQSQGQQGQNPSEGQGEGQEGSGEGNGQKEGEGQQQGQGSGKGQEKKCTCPQDHSGQGQQGQGQGDRSKMRVMDDHSYWESGIQDEDMVKQAIKSWVESAREETIRKHGSGSIPRELLDKLEDLLKEKVVDWRRVVKNFIGRKITFDVESTRKRPNRRLGLKATGKKFKPGPGILFATDCSGSVGNHEYLIFLSEAVNATKLFREKAKMLFFDWDLLKDKKGEPLIYKLGDQKKLPQRPMQGGTNFQPVIDYANKVKPDLLVIFTDGEAPAPTKANCPVLWVICGGRDNPELKGKRLLLPKEWDKKKVSKMVEA
jgi:predicted metal-dependent peptidase